MVNEQRLLDEFLELVAIDSESRSEGKLAEVLAEKLKKLGFEVHVDNAGESIGGETGNIIARLKGNDDTKQSILFAAHMDTVAPGKGVKASVKDKMVVSDGTTILGADDKAGIAAVLEMSRLLKEDAKHGDIEAVFTIAEEGGLFGAKGLDYSQIQSKIGYILDSDGKPGTIVNQGPCQDKISVTIKGVSAHAGLKPEEGISAIQVASKAINDMKLLRIDEDTTANIGVIKGGTATNVVCDNVEVLAEARSTSEEKLDAQSKHMKECFESAAAEFSTEADVSIERVYPAFLIKEEEPVVKIVKEKAKDLGLEPTLKATGGGSDTNIFNGNGISCVNLGLGMNNPHTLEESIEVKDLVDITRLIFSIAKA
ncbi:M20/M25/M40 family metallo-hydrolase [Proteinivorax hydrogeniformans]|uniref:M20/M25/M40 family metallo-hydrolase n=1 Tax=Proteinivorax hydrogeniformans TaxID=1826727 RepID=A0AAU8HT29_9FIRM